MGNPWRRFLGQLFILGLIVEVSHGLQRFADQPRYTEVNPSQDALLTCKIIDKRGTCSWQKDNKPVGIYPKKYEWAGGALGMQGIASPHIGGDCSLWVRSATLDFDDGLWECQVTASDFTTQDALTSQPVRLVVRVPPQRPRLEYEGTHVPPGHNVTADSGAAATVKCVSHYGNPPAQLKWFLGDHELSALHPQTNATEPDNPRTWSAASVVQIPATRERHGAILKCLAVHESYAAKSVPVEARMDVRYAPTIRLLGAPQIDLEEGKDSLVVRCEADANPPASIVWRRAGRSEITSLQESLQLRPVGRRDAGLYTCQAQNSVGMSDSLTMQLDIKYSPKILSAGPDRLTTAPLFSPAAFECVAEGNPPPTYKWMQRVSSTGSFVERGRESRLVIDNVTYDYQGDYECRAVNFINGQERSVSSESIALQVVGAPQVLRLNPALQSITVRRGSQASLSMVVCADPRPRHVTWEWGSLRLEAGGNMGHYHADEVVQDSREDCYLAKLHIIDADFQDSRPYYLVVENDRGADRHAIHLRVEEPFELSYLLGIAGGCLAALFILICLCVYAVRSKKCCFKGRNNYKTTEKDSEKADLKCRSDSSAVGGPALDSIYTTPAGFSHPNHLQIGGGGGGGGGGGIGGGGIGGIGGHHHQHHLGIGIGGGGGGGGGGGIGIGIGGGGQNSPEAMKLAASTQYGSGRRTPIGYILPVTESRGGGRHTCSTATGGGELVLAGQRHHRDLFTGSGQLLGIPDVSTRVGSVVHAFETLAMESGGGVARTDARQRPPTPKQSGERPYELFNRSVHRRSDRQCAECDCINATNHSHGIEMSARVYSTPSIHQLIRRRRDNERNGLGQHRRNADADDDDDEDDRNVHEEADDDNDDDDDEDDDGQNLHRHHRRHRHHHHRHHHIATTLPAHFSLAGETFETTAATEVAAQRRAVQNRNCHSPKLPSFADSVAVHIDDDYRKNQFGTHSTKPPHYRQTATDSGTFQQHRLHHGIGIGIGSGDPSAMATHRRTSIINSYGASCDNIIMSSSSSSAVATGITKNKVHTDGNATNAMTQYYYSNNGGFNEDTADVVSRVSRDHNQNDTFRYNAHKTGHRNGNMEAELELEMELEQEQAVLTADGDTTSLFQRDTTVSKSFIKNVRNGRRRQAPARPSDAATIMHDNLVAIVDNDNGDDVEKRIGGHRIAGAVSPIGLRSTTGSKVKRERDRNLQPVQQQTVIGGVTPHRQRLHSTTAAATAATVDGASKRKLFKPRTIDRAII